MVFCYKIITESPRRSQCVSPRKASPVGRFSSDSLNYLQYNSNKGEFWDSIPERDWRLLAALAKKREEEDEREKLAEQFQKMWLKEKEEREMVEAETTEQYKRFLNRKRSQERYFHEYKRLQRNAEQQLKKGQLIHCIKYKEQKSADLLAWRDDRKITELISKAIEDEARANLAAERRHLSGVADEWKKQIELVHTLRKADDAKKRRSALLRDASQRLAITNALTSWETSLIRQEVEAMAAAKRAHTIAHNAIKDVRSVRVNRAKEMKRNRGRRLAAITAQMRDAIKGSR